MFCRYCGKEIGEQMAFCGYCGKPVRVQEKPPVADRVAQIDRGAAEQIADIQEDQIAAIQEEQKRVCPNCGAEIEGKRQFCMKCGTWVPRRQRDPDPKPDPDPDPIPPVPPVDPDKPVIILQRAYGYTGRPTPLKVYEAEGKLTLYPDRLHYEVFSGNPILYQFGFMGAVVGNASARKKLEGEIALTDISSAEAADFGKNKALILTLKTGKTVSFVPQGDITRKEDHQNAIQTLMDMADVIQGLI